MRRQITKPLSTQAKKRAQSIKAAAPNKGQTKKGAAGVVVVAGGTGAYQASSRARSNNVRRKATSNPNNLYYGSRNQHSTLSPNSSDFGTNREGGHYSKAEFSRRRKEELLRGSGPKEARARAGGRMTLWASTQPDVAEHFAGGKKECT